MPTSADIFRMSRRPRSSMEKVAIVMLLDKIRSRYVQRAGVPTSVEILQARRDTARLFTGHRHLSSPHKHMEGANPARSVNIESTHQPGFVATAQWSG